MDSHLLDLFLKNRITPPREGRHFRTHGIVHKRPQRLKAQAVDARASNWAHVAGVLLVVVFVVALLVYGVSL